MTELDQKLKRNKIVKICQRIANLPRPKNEKEVRACNIAFEKYVDSIMEIIK